MIILKLFSGVFIVFAVVLFISQSFGIDVSNEQDFASKLAVLIEKTNWGLVLGVSIVAGLFAALTSALRFTPIGRAFDARDEE